MEYATDLYDIGYDSVYNTLKCLFGELDIDEDDNFETPKLRMLNLLRKIKMYSGNSYDFDENDKLKFNNELNYEAQFLVDGKKISIFFEENGDILKSDTRPYFTYVDVINDVYRIAFSSINRTIEGKPLYISYDNKNICNMQFIIYNVDNKFATFINRH